MEKWRDFLMREKKLRIFSFFKLPSKLPSKLLSKLPSFLLTPMVCFYFLLPSCLKTRQEVQSIESYQQNQTQVGQMQKASSFDMSSRVGEIEEILRTVLGQVEELHHKQAQLEQEKNQMRSSQASEQDLLVQDLTRKMTAVLEELKISKAELQDLKAHIALLQEEKNQQQGSLAPVQDHWSQAEELFETKEYRKAILSYQKYRENNPKGSQFSQATYKIGLSFEKLSMIEEAKSFYVEVVEKFPKSEEAQKAKIRLKKLK
jgi:tetratricopeptide (TPR) repeat protein